jgi:hypothetical protein
MSIPTPDAVLAAYANRLIRLSTDVEDLARCARTFLPQDDLTAVWAIQRDLLLTALSVRPVPPPRPAIPDSV